MGLNNNGPGGPLAWWAVRFLGRTVGRGLFDDPYYCSNTIYSFCYYNNLFISLLGEYIIILRESNVDVGSTLSLPPRHKNKARDCEYSFPLKRGQDRCTSKEYYK